MAAQLDVCRFTPTAGGTTDFTYSSAIVGYQSPTAAGVVNGRAYKYRAESADLSQWENGEGTYNTSTGVLTRTTVLFNSAGSTAKINFAVAPNVGIVLLKEDLISVEESNAFTATQKAQARANIDVLKKNYIINGAMMISQENGTTAGTTSGYYPADQWSILTSAIGTGTFSAVQVASTSLAGSPNRLRLTVTAAQATVGSSLVYFQQKIEGYRVADLQWGTASAKTVTFQVGIKAPVAGTYVVQISNTIPDASAAGTITIGAGEVNTDVVKAVTLTGTTSGTWAKDNTAGFLVQVFLMHSSQTANVFATNGNVFELFDVGLYEGSAAPAFMVPDRANELSLSQDYWEKSYDYGVAPGAVNAAGVECNFFGASSGTFNVGAICPRYKRRKRATPAITVYSDGTGASGKLRDRVNGVDITPTATDLIGETGFRTYGSVTAGSQMSISCHWTANARL